jgi:hypothetical protein
MHFNDLLIRLRTQALGGVATVVTVIGLLTHESDASPEKLWSSVAAVSFLLFLAWTTICVIDLCYYGRLLRGAVESLLVIESKTEGFIDFSHTIERTVKKRKDVGPGKSRNRASWQSRFFTP